MPSPQTPREAAIDALRDLAAFISHWEEDRRYGLLPTETSLRTAKAIAARAIAKEE